MVDRQPDRRLCRLLGHSWRLREERWKNPNRHDLGGVRSWYCTRCRVIEETNR
jgi:hypothetical protein